MNLNVFKLEEYLTKYEFTAPYLMCSSDAESFSMQEIIAMADGECQALWNGLTLKYTEPYGLPQLREQIAASLYPTLKADNILCFAGAEEGIYTALSVICEPKDHIIVLTPCYQSLMEVSKKNGSEVSLIELRDENEWKIDIAEIKRHIKANTKCIVINFPHNPTGQVITEEELKELIALCALHDLWLFSDEVYRLLGAPKHGWTAPAASMYPKALSLGVMSKAFGMAGLRVGWIACQDAKMIHQMKIMKDYLSICNSAPAEIISLITLRAKDKILQRNNQIVASNLKLLDEFMDEYKQLFTWVRPSGGCVGFVKYKGQDSVENFTERLIKEKGVLLMPASIYDYPGSNFRIGFGRKNMPEGLVRFREFLAV